MSKQILSAVDSKIKSYQKEHRGDKPLFLLMTEEEADYLMEEVRVNKGYGDDIIITDYEGTKIVRDPALKKGDILLTNELPETSS